MPGINCVCGALLVDEVTATGVRPRGQTEALVFRRTTDHVICDRCFASYDVRGLLELASDEHDAALLGTLAQQLD
jgi:hypothetical protein